MAGPGPAAAAPAGRVLFHLSDPRIDEASGIALGIRSPGVVYVQNDSGHAARFFALDAQTGRVLAVYSVPGAVNVDWEDLAVAPDDRGVPSIWIADTGDNDDNRREVRIYRVDEPAVPRTESSTGARPTTAPDLWRLRYPDGPHDVEALAVAPGGAMVLMTKVIFGPTQVFAVPARPDASRVRRLARIGSFHTDLSGTPGGPNPAGELTVTGAALSRDGSRLVARTYTDAYLWRVSGGHVAAALRGGPVRIALPPQPQGEGIAFDGGLLLLDSEGVGTAVRSVPVPAPPRAVRTTSPSPNGSTSSAPSASSAVSAPSGSGVAAGNGPAGKGPAGNGSAGNGSAGDGPAWWLVGGLAAVAAGGLLAVKRTVLRRTVFRRAVLRRAGTRRRHPRA